eukprot:GHVP01029037.1.p1 GENE.GHVP01029037.1~~GHVP01029037.1.p1  ORF type:complete len:137 (+),score=16.57 GHVP01029037.1:252-662(+)
MYNKFPQEIDTSNILEKPRRNQGTMQRTPSKAKASIEAPVRRKSSPSTLPPVIPKPIPQQPEENDSEYDPVYEEVYYTDETDPILTFPHNTRPHLSQHNPQHPTFKSSYNSSTANPYVLLFNPISTNHALRMTMDH